MRKFCLDVFLSVSFIAGHIGAITYMREPDALVDLANGNALQVNISMNDEGNSSLLFASLIFHMLPRSMEKQKWSPFDCL